MLEAPVCDNYNVSIWPNNVLKQPRILGWNSKGWVCAFLTPTQRFLSLYYKHYKTLIK